MPPAARPYTEAARANTQKAAPRSATTSVSPAVSSSSARAVATGSPSMARPTASGVRRVKSHAMGASPSTRAMPTPAQATRQPFASAAACTVGKAIMKPIVIRTA